MYSWSYYISQICITSLLPNTFTEEISSKLLPKREKISLVTLLLHLVIAQYIKNVNFTKWTINFLSVIS